MAWGTEEDVDRLVRRALKNSNVLHRAEVAKLKARIEKLKEELDALHQQQAGESW